MIKIQKPEIIETYNEIRSPGFAHIRTENELDHLAINSPTHYNDEAIERVVSHIPKFGDLHMEMPRFPREMRDIHRKISKFRDM